MELFTRALCDSKLAADKTIEIAKFINLNSLICSSQVRLLNALSEAYFVVQNYQLGIEAAQSSFKVDPNITSLFWLCKSSALSTGISESIFHQISICLDSAENNILEAILILLETVFGLERVIRHVEGWDGCAKELMPKIILCSKSLAPVQKADLLISTNISPSSDSLPLIEDLYEQLFKESNIDLCLKLVNVFKKTLSPSDPNFDHNIGVVERKAVDCLLALGRIEEAEAIINLHSQTEVAWVVRGFDLRIRRNQQDLAEMCFDQLLLGDFCDECLYCVSLCQRTANRKFSFKLMKKIIERQRRQASPIAIKAFVSLSTEFDEDIDIDLLEECFLVLKKDAKDFLWCLGAVWSLVARCLNGKMYSMAHRLIVIAKSFSKKESTESFVLLYYELIILLNIPNQDHLITDILSQFNEKKSLMDRREGKGRWSFLNIDVCKLMENCTALQFKICLYTKDLNTARDIIDSLQSAEELCNLIKLLTNSVTFDYTGIVELLAEKSLELKQLSSSDALFISRTLLLLNNDFGNASFVQRLQTLLQQSDMNEQVEEQLIWVIVYVHNTALDLFASRYHKQAAVWSECALSLCTKLPPASQGVYERTIRSAFLHILSQTCKYK